MVETDEVTVEETGDEVADEFLNAGMPDGIDDGDGEGEDEAGGEEQEAEERESTDGRARDAHGRFVAKEAEGEPPVEAAAQDTGAPTDAATPEATAPPAELPFTVKVSGQEYGLDGAMYVPGEGLYVPDQHYDLVRSLIQEGAYYKQNWKALEQTATRRGFETALREAPEIQQAQALTKVISDLFENPEALAEAYENWSTMGPMYREKAMREMAERELEALKRGDQSRQEEEAVQREEADKWQALSDTMSELRQVPDLKVLTPDDWDMIDKQIATLNARGGLYVTMEDGLYLDTNAIEEVAAHVFNVRKQVVDAAKKAEEAARFNALNKPKAQAKPPVAQVTPRKGSPPKKTDTPAKEDYRSVRRAFLDEKLDFDD